MYWLKLTGLFVPILAYMAIVYGSMAPMEPQVNILIGCMAFLLGGLAASSFHEIERWLDIPSRTFGTASLASVWQMARAGLFGLRGVFLGRVHGLGLRFRKPGHMLTLAPTRAGKGTCAVIPNLLEHPGSVVTVDIKGENYAIAGRRRRHFGRVLKFAPFEADSHCFNPLDFIRGGDEAWDDAAMLADMLVVPSGASKAIFFENEARALLTGLILYVATEAPREARNLYTLRRLITLGGEDLDAQLKRMLRAKHPMVRFAATSFSRKDERLQSSILAEAQTHTLVWDSSRVARVTSRSDFSLTDLKSATVSLFIIVPPEALAVYRPLIRLILGMAVRTMTRPGYKPINPVLFLIDEFPALGHMKPIEEGIAYLAGYGCKLWLFAQDMGQLESVYGEHAARSIIANTNLQAFNNTDERTLELLSRMLGNATVRAEHRSASRSSLLLPDYHHFNVGAGETARPLLTPDEIRCLGDGRQLLFLKGLRPILARKEAYYTAWCFKGLWDTWREQSGNE